MCCCRSGAPLAGLQPALAPPVGYPGGVGYAVVAPATAAPPQAFGAVPPAAAYRAENAGQTTPCDARLPAMSSSTYRSILMLLGRYTFQMPDADHDEFSEEQWALRQDMSFGKVRWYGNWCLDLWCFLRNNNPIFATCYSHPLHPVSRAERIFVYCTMIVFKIVLAFFVAKGHDCVEFGLTDCGASESIFEEALERAPPEHLFCCACSRLGIIWFEQDLDFGLGLGSKLYTLLGGALYAILMFHLMACNCAQRHHSERRRHCGEFIGYLVAGMITILVVGIIGPWVFVYCVRNGLLGEAITTFLWAQALSWAGTILFVPGVLWFAVLNCRERHAEMTGDRKFHVTAEEYRAYLQLAYVAR